MKAMTTCLVLSVLCFGTASGQTTEEEEQLRKAEALFGRLTAKADKMTVKMIDDLDHRKAEKRQAAAEFLGMREEKAAVPGLIRLLDDPVADVRQESAGALWRIGSPDAEPAIPALERVVARDRDGRVRVRAAGALWVMGAPTSELVPHLEPVLDDSSGYRSVRAANLLLQMGVDAKRVLPTYERAMSSRDGSLREYAVETLADHEGTPRVFEPLLIEAVGDREVPVRILAVAELSMIGSPSPAAIAALQKATRDPSEFVRSTALEAVGRVAPDAGPGGSSAVDDLLRGLRDRKTHVRVGAARGLGDIKASSPEAIEALIAALTDKKDEVRGGGRLRSRSDREPGRQSGCSEPLGDLERPQPALDRAALGRPYAGRPR